MTAPPGPSARLAVAAFLASDGQARVLDSDNKIQEWLPLEQAVEDDRSFFIVPERDVLAVDFDGAGARDAARELYLRLRFHGFPAVLLDSGGGVATAPRRHVFAVMRGGVIDARWSEIAKELGGDVRTTGIRPPWTLHRSGSARSQPVGGIDETEVIARLADETSMRPLRPRDIALIVEGTGAHTNRSMQLVEVITTLIEHEWPKWEILLLLEHEEFAIGQIYADARTDRHHSGDDWLSLYLYRDALARATPQRELHLRRVAKVRTVRMRQILARKNDIAARLTDIKTMELFLKKVANLDRWDIVMASRNLQVEANIGSPVTATNSLYRLLDEGVLARSRRSRQVSQAKRAYAYRIVQPSDVELDGVPETPELGFLLDDVFRHGKGDGPGAGLVHCMLLTNPQGLTVEEVAEVTVSHTTTARNRLDRLVAAALAVEHDGRYYATAVQPSPGMYPEATSARRRALRRHEKERAEWEKRLAQKQ